MSRSHGPSQRFGSWVRSAKQNLKKFCAGTHRAREREALRAQRLEDDALSAKSHQRAEDPWAWD